MAGAFHHGVWFDVDAAIALLAKVEAPLTREVGEMLEGHAVDRRCGLCAKLARLNNYNECQDCLTKHCTEPGCDRVEPCHACRLEN